MGAGSPLFGAPSLAFPALSRDATLLLSSSGPLIAGDSQSRLYAMPAATFVPGVTGLPADLLRRPPFVLASDTHHLAFNFWSGSFDANGGNPAVSADRASLVLLDFDGERAFSNPAPLALTPPASASTDSSAPGRRGDVLGVSSRQQRRQSSALQLSNKSHHYWGYTWGEEHERSQWLDLATQKVHRLDALNGLSNTGVPNLPATAPHSAEQDAVVNYEPTVGPIRPVAGKASIEFPRAVASTGTSPPRTPGRAIPATTPGRTWSPRRSSGSPPSISTPPPAPTRATPPSTCPRRSSTPATRADTGASTPAGQTGLPAKRRDRELRRLVDVAQTPR